MDPMPLRACPDWMVEARGLTKTYRRGAEEIRALDGVDLTLWPGEFICLLGPSGAGKTTLLNQIGCLDVPTAGALSIAGQSICGNGASRLSEAQRDRLRRENIGFIFADFFLLPTLTAWENVHLPLLWSGRRDPVRARELLERVGLGHRLTHRPRELSGGEMQRVAVARALIHRPKLLLADEPTGNVDTTTRDGLLELFQELNAEGLTILLATHDHELAERVDRVVRLEDGRIV